MLDHRIETQTKKLRSSTPGTTQYDSGVKYLLDSFEFIREYDDEMKRTARASEEEDVEGPTCDEPCSPTQPPRGVGSFVSVSSNRDTRRIYDEFLASVEGDVDAMLRISGGSDASSAHPSLPT